MGHTVVQLVRHCATSQTVVGLIPVGVTGILHWNKVSGPTMALGFNKNEYQEYFLGVKAAGA